MTDSHSKLWASRDRTPEILVERQIPEPDSSSPESQLLGIESRKLHFQIRLIWGRFVVVHSLNCVQLCVTPWIAACQDSLSFTISQSLCVCSDLCPLSPLCYLTISYSATPFSFCLQSFPALGSFPMTWIFASCGQSTGESASASVLPMNIKG